MRVKFAVSALVVTLSVTVSAGRNKFIAHGWDLLRTSPREILANIEKWEKVPVDGVVFSVNGKGLDGSLLTIRHVATERGWTAEAFAEQVSIMRQIVAHKNMSESFLGVWFQYYKAEHRLDWTDDAAWANFAANMGILAKIVREAGLKGLCIDNEDYGKCSQYYRKDGELPYDELRVLARRRGREVFEPVFREVPDITLMTFFLLSFDFDYVSAPDRMALERKKGDLWPAFLEGILEVMPENARIFDGNEKGYTYRAETADYYRAAVRTVNGFAELLEPAFRNRYRAHVRASVGFYLDGYASKNPESYYYLPPTVGGTQVDRLADNLIQADQACDGYIWIYGEQHPWVPWRPREKKMAKCLTSPTWNETLPGFHGILSSIRDGGVFARERIAEVEAAGGASNCVSAVTTWKHDKDKGRLFMDKSVSRKGGTKALCLDGVRRGCYIVRLNGSAPAKTYVIRVAAKGESEDFSVYFTKRGAWRFPLGSVKGVFGEPMADGWRVGYATVTIPFGADGFGAQLCGDKNGKVWYDDVVVYAAR